MATMFVQRSLTQNTRPTLMINTSSETSTLGAGFGNCDGLPAKAPTHPSLPQNILNPGQQIVSSHRKSGQRNLAPSPPMLIRKSLEETICPGSTHLKTPISPAVKSRRCLDLHRFAKEKLRNSPRLSPSRQVQRERNTGCLKRSIDSPGRTNRSLVSDPEETVLDELRACQNCSSKFFTNRDNEEASAFFCSGECMWSAIMKGD